MAHVSIKRARDACRVGPEDLAVVGFYYIQLASILDPIFFFFSSRRRHTRFDCDWSSDVCSSDLLRTHGGMGLLYWTGGKLSNCRIRVVYKMRDFNDNSGVFIRIPVEPREEWMPDRKSVV